MTGTDTKLSSCSNFQALLTHLLLVIIGDVIVNVIWELQVSVNIARVRILGVWANRKFLLLLPL